MSKTWKLNENTRKAIKRRIESGDLRLGGPSVSIGEHVYAILDGSGQVEPYVLFVGEYFSVKVSEIMMEEVRA